MFRLLAVLAVLYSYYEIRSGLPPAVGRGLGIAASVWVSLGAEVFLTGILLAVPWIGRRCPEYVHFGSRTFCDYTPPQRERIMPLLKNMVGLMALATNLFFAFDIHQHIAMAQSGGGPPSPLFLVGLIICDGIILWYYLGRFDEEAGRE